METTTLEGTWEEILQHAPQLAGQWVKVTILDQPIASSQTHEPIPQPPPAEASEDPLSSFIGAVSHGSLATNLDSELYGR
jgi:hypothetical protein